MFSHIKVGDKVTRMLAGIIPMDLIVSEVTEKTIICGSWTFNKKTGAEIDEDCGWNDQGTGSILVPKNP